MLLNFCWLDKWVNLQDFLIVSTWVYITVSVRLSPYHNLRFHSSHLTIDKMITLPSLLVIKLPHCCGSGWRPSKHDGAFVKTRSGSMKASKLGSPLSAWPEDTICHSLASLVRAGGSKQLTHGRSGSRGKASLSASVLLSWSGRDSVLQSRKIQRLSKRGKSIDKWELLGQNYITSLLSDPFSHSSHQSIHVSVSITHPPNSPGPAHTQIGQAVCNL